VVENEWKRIELEFLLWLVEWASRVLEVFVQVLKNGQGFEIKKKIKKDRMPN
jgi:hypothetical protein